MHLFTTLTTAFTTLNLLSAANAYKWDADAEKFCRGNFFSGPQPPLEGSWGSLKVDENGECYIALNEILGCNGASKPFATYNATSGYCDAFGGVDPMTAPICGGYLWFFAHDYKDKLVPPMTGNYDTVNAGDLFVKSKGKVVNNDPYNLGKAGCHFEPVYKDGEFQHLKQECGLVRKPVGKWTG